MQCFLRLRDWLLGSWPQYLRRIVLPGLLLAFSALASAAGDSPNLLRICIADTEVPFFTAPNHEGLAQRALRQAARMQGREVAFVVRPWRRCFAEASEGSLHGILPVVYSDSTRQVLRFPEVDGRPDESLQLDSVRILVMRLRGSTVDWDGQHFSGLQRPVLYLRGMKILDDYFAHSGLQADSSVRNVRSLGLMLLRNRSSVAVDLEWRVKRLMQDEPFHSSIEVLPKPLLIVPSYLGISPALQAEQPDFVAQLWRDIAPAYLRILTETGPSAAP